MKYKAKDGIKVERSEKINLLRRRKERRKQSQTHIFIKIYILILNITLPTSFDMEKKLFNRFAAMGNTFVQSWCKIDANKRALGRMMYRNLWRRQHERRIKLWNLEHYTFFAGYQVIIIHHRKKRCEREHNSKGEVDLLFVASQSIIVR